MTSNNVWLSSRFENAWLSEGWGEIQRSNNWVKNWHPWQRTVPKLERLLWFSHPLAVRAFANIIHMCTVSRGFALRLDQLGKLTNRLCSGRASKPNYKPPKLVNHLGQNKMMKRRRCAGQGWPSYKGLWVTVCESQWAVRTSGQRGLVSFVTRKRSKGDKESTEGCRVDLHCQRFQNNC